MDVERTCSPACVDLRQFDIYGLTLVEEEHELGLPHHNHILSYPCACAHVHISVYAVRRGAARCGAVQWARRGVERLRLQLR